MCMYVYASIACMHCMHACMRACMHAHCMCVCMDAYIHARARTHTHTDAGASAASACTGLQPHRACGSCTRLPVHAPTACLYRTGVDWPLDRTGINWPHIARVPTLNRSTAQACSGRPRVYSPHTGRSRTGRARDGSRAAPRGRGSGSGVWQHVCVGQAPAYVDACVRRACRGV